MEKAISRKSKREKKPKKFFDEVSKDLEMEGASKRNKTGIGLSTEEEHRKYENIDIVEPSSVTSSTSSVSGNSIRVFSCNKCKMVFQTDEQQRLHNLKHVKDKRFVCDYCGKEWKDRKTLVTHIRMHTGEKPFKCSICGRGFSQQATLTHHLHVHRGIKPHLCDLCGKSFTQKSQLSTHRARHLNYRAFQCHLCNYAFFAKGELQRHLRSHQNLKPFQCGTCQRSFTRATALRDHRNRQHCAATVSVTGGHIGNDTTTASTDSLRPRAPCGSADSDDGVMRSTGDGGEGAGSPPHEGHMEVVLGVDEPHAAAAPEPSGSTPPRVSLVLCRHCREVHVAEEFQAHLETCRQRVSRSPVTSHEDAALAPPDQAAELLGFSPGVADRAILVLTSAGPVLLDTGGGQADVLEAGLLDVVQYDQRLVAPLQVLLVPSEQTGQLDHDRVELVEHVSSIDELVDAEEHRSAAPVEGTRTHELMLTLDHHPFPAPRAGVQAATSNGSGAAAPCPGTSTMSVPSTSEGDGTGGGGRAEDGGGAVVSPTSAVGGRASPLPSAVLVTDAASAGEVLAAPDVGPTAAMTLGLGSPHVSLVDSAAEGFPVDIIQDGVSYEDSDLLRTLHYGPSHWD